jgi:hypothetical protein
MVDQNKKDALLREAEHLLAAEGRDGLHRWLVAAKGFFPDAADVSMDFIKLAVRHGFTTETGWLLQQVCRVHPLRLDILEVLGKYTRSTQPVVGPPTNDSSPPANPADSEFVTIVGSSYVRSFASGTRFLPLMVGPGRATSFVTQERAAITQRMTLNNIARVDPRSLVMLVYGNADAINHLRDDYGTWTAVENGIIPSHAALMTAAAERYCGMISEIRRRHALNLVVCCAFPMLDPRYMPLVETFNATVRAFGKHAGIPVLDVTAPLKDPITGCLKPEMCSAEGNDHLGHGLVSLVEQGLKDLGILPKQSHVFSWDYMFRFAVDPEVETRIWSEPYIGAGNILHSRKIMFTQIVERAMHMFIGALAIWPGTVLVINGKEGFVPLELAPAQASKVTSVDSMEKSLMGRRIARFAGRGNVDFIAQPLVNIAADGASYDYAFMIVHQTDDGEACAALLPALAAKIKRGVFILTALDWEARVTAMTGSHNVVSVGLANRLVTGYWAGAKLYALSH